MRRFLVAFIVMLSGGPAGASLGPDQPPRAQSPQPAGTITYEPLAPGVQAAQLFRTNALRDAVLEVKDVIFGPGKSAPARSVQGFEVTELKSGEVETTIDAQTTKRRPGDFWLVRPGQTYSVANGPGPAVLHVVLFTRP
jgi:quercetin dioxygenase-like cupin family protein